MRAILATPPLASLWRVSLFALAGLAIFGAIHAWGQTPDHLHSNPWLKSWIPSSCCVTNDCCWEVSERELTPLSDDRWRINSTGQELKRTDWSQDGKFYRCACDYDGSTRVWNRHQGANTRCLFVPIRGF